MKYAFIVICALLLSCPFVLPAVYFVLQHMPEGSDFLITPLNNPVKSSLSLFFGRNDFGIFHLLPAIYCGWGSFIFFIVFFFSKTNDMKKKILIAIPFAFLMICVFWHPAYLMMHLFNEPDSFPWRFSYLIIFLMTSVGAYQFGKTDIKKFSLRHLIPLATMVVFIVFSYIVCEGELFVSLKMFVLNIVFILILSFYFDKPEIVYWVCVLELLFSVYLQLSIQVGSLTNNQQIIQEKMDMVDLSVDKFKTELNSEWRTCCNVPSTNASLIYGYNDLNYFCSFIDSNLVYALGNLGFMARPQQYDYFGLTEFTSMIFSVRYILEDSYDAKIIENSTTLPIAFAVSGDIVEYSPVNDNGLDPFYNQQLLADSMTIEDAEIFEDVDLYISLDENLSISAIDDKGYMISKGEGIGNAYWFSDAVTDNKIYAYLNSERGVGLYDQNIMESGSVFDELTSSTTVSLPHIYSFFEDEDSAYPFIVMHMNNTSPQNVYFGSGIAKCVNMDSINKIYDELMGGALCVDDFSDTKIRGHFESDSEHSILFTSIPYDKDWHIYIDGSECETFSVVDRAFLACKVTPGVHEVEFRYSDSSVMTGKYIFAFGIVLFFLYGYIERKRN